MRSALYWLDESWPGRLALAARPRGGDWLKDELHDWKESGIRTILSLLTSQEESDLDLKNEAQEARAERLQFLSFPIADRQVPTSEARLAALLDKVKSTLSAGGNVVVHCRQGVGRSGLVAACLLIGKGFGPGAAIEKVSAARGVTVPETDEQREWIEHYATAFTK